MIKLQRLKDDVLYQYIKRGFVMKKSWEKDTQKLKYDASTIERYKKTGKDVDRDSVIKEYAKLVKYIAAQLYTKNGMYILELGDYESYGIIGLLDAIERYDIESNIKFETYASYRIKGAILDELRKIDNASRRIRENQKEYKHMQNIALEKYGPNYTRKQLLLANNINEETLKQLEKYVAIEEAISLDGLFYATDSDTDGFDVGDYDVTHATDYQILHQDLKYTLDKAMSRLTEREKQVITMVYYNDMTLKEIGNILNVTESRVSQLHINALKKLRENEVLKSWGAV